MAALDITSSMLRRLFKFGTTFTILVMSLLVLLILSIIGVFYPTVFSYLDSLHIFELLITCALVELLYLQLSNLGRDDTVGGVLAKEQYYYPTLLAALQNNRPDSVDILSAGLSSRYQLIIEILELQVPVRVLIQSENFAIDKVDAGRAHSILELIKRSVPEKANRYLEVRGVSNIVSVRAIIIRHQRTSAMNAVVSWYTYDCESMLMGHDNPSILVSGRNANQQALLTFATNQFDKCWDASKSSVIFPLAN